jgi:hypothetical protein
MFNIKEEFEKRGQFYIVAAIIIIGVILGFVTMSNYAVAIPKPAKVYDLSGQLSLESGQVIDAAIYNGTQDVNTAIDNFAQNFSNYANQYGNDTELVFIYGDDKNIYVASYSEINDTTFITGNENPPGPTINISSSKESTWNVLNYSRYQWEEGGSGLYANSGINEKIVKIKLGENNEPIFFIKEGQFFSYIMIKKIGSEEYVTSKGASNT